MSRLLFLSHSSVDKNAARALRARILESPEAAQHDLKVWFDEDDLRAGEPWQPQLEDAINKSDVFAVYVGSQGIVNWVEPEVRFALERAVADSDFRFIPIFTGQSLDPERLPAFARQYQSVFNVEKDPLQYERLLRAVLGNDDDSGKLKLEEKPFFGLRAIDTSRSHLFFGREEETEKLTSLVHQAPLVLVTGDSGSGKSSLVRAGLIPRYRGGAFAKLERGRPQDAIWHVVTMRPRSEPFRSLGEAVEQAARRLELPLEEQGTLAAWARSRDIEKMRQGLRCGLESEQVRVLLVVDQFEELLTVTPLELREPFINLLLDLSDPADGRYRVVLTMRHDYANLCNAYEPLRKRLDDNDRWARFRLGRMSDAGLKQIVAEPLRLAGVEEAERQILASEVLRDVGERPGDLALLQMALTETWDARHLNGDDLLRAYGAVGRVEGALAQAAEEVRTDLADDEYRTRLDTILIRLVRLGDTGGATRRVASRIEFDDAQWSLIELLAGEKGKRLVLLGGGGEEPTVEIAHEALVTAWPHFQNLLQGAVEDKRIFDAFIPRAAAWSSSPEGPERVNRQISGFELEQVSSLLTRYPNWFSAAEKDLIRQSESYYTRQTRTKKLILVTLSSAILYAFVYFSTSHLEVDIENGDIQEYSMSLYQSSSVDHFPKNGLPMGYHDRICPVFDVNREYQVYSALNRTKYLLKRGRVWLELKLLTADENKVGHRFCRLITLVPGQTTKVTLRIPGAEHIPETISVDSIVSEDHSIDDSLEIGKYEVTFAEYTNFLETLNAESGDSSENLLKNYGINDSGWGQAEKPVINVDWYNACAFVNWLGDQTGQYFRLPTEDEWLLLYNQTVRQGKEPCQKDQRSDVADEEMEETQYVMNANAYNDIFGMDSNVSEWSADEWSEGKPNETEEYRKVILGPYGRSNEGSCFRFAFNPRSVFKTLGFRVVKSTNERSSNIGACKELSRK